MKTVTKVRQWGVRHTNGRIEPISASSANEGYMTAQEYATRRAAVTNGQVVRRTITTTITEGEWKAVTS